MDNIALWERFADIDPEFAKPITGKPYNGTSPNPQYVIRCLTELFGPVGQGFGWRVVAEDFTEMGGETIHWCRIEFWHTDRANVVESYGQTRAAYVTSRGKQVVDEDAPKKSLTDAVVKAASWVGVCANIFLGRWDDQKYVAKVNEEYRGSEEPPPEETRTRIEEPPPEETRNRIKKAMQAAKDCAALEKIWDNHHTKAAFAKLPAPMQAELTKVHSDMNAKLFQAPADDWPEGNAA